MWVNLWRFKKRRIVWCDWAFGSLEEVGGIAGSRLEIPTSVVPTPVTTTK